ncbi:hypothetical protein HDV00_010563 [Rhizophlyctis rosea]|nr:hypothetical protein HDV00_010563 [Rhizophlyctis rosea]
MKILITIIPKEADAPYITGTPGLTDFTISGIVTIQNTDAKPRSITNPSIYFRCDTTVIPPDVQVQDISVIRTEKLKSRTMFLKEVSLVDGMGSSSIEIGAGTTTTMPFSMHVPSPSSGGPQNLPPLPMKFGREVAEHRYQLIAVVDIKSKGVFPGMTKNKTVRKTVNLTSSRWIDRKILRSVVGSPAHLEGDIGWEGGRPVGLPKGSTGLDENVPIDITCNIQTSTFPTLLPSSTLHASISVRPTQPQPTLPIQIHSVEITLVQYTQSNLGTPQNPDEERPYDPFTICSQKIVETVTGELWKVRDVELHIPTFRSKVQHNDDTENAKDSFLPTYTAKGALLHSWHALKIIIRYAQGGKYKKAVVGCSVKVAGFTIEDVERLRMTHPDVVREVEGSVGEEDEADELPAYLEEGDEGI